MKCSAITGFVNIKPMTIANYSKLIFLSLLIGFSFSSFAKQPEFIIGFPEDNMSNDWRAAQMNEIKNELKKHPNVRFLMSDAAGSIAKNIFDIEDMVSQGAQLLFLGPKNPAAIAPIASKLRKKGIRIILLTRKLNTEDYDVFISPDDFKIAYDAGLYMANHLKGKGRVLMLEGVRSTSTSIRRKAGFLASLQNYSGIKVLKRTANYSRTAAILVIENLLKKGVKFDAIYAHNDAMAAGARFALKRAGISPSSIPTIGIDFLPETREAIIQGEQLASYTYPTCGKVGVAAAIKLLTGKKVPRYISIPSKLVNINNVKETPTIY